MQPQRFGFSIVANLDNCEIVFGSFKNCNLDDILNSFEIPNELKKELIYNLHLF